MRTHTIATCAALCALVLLAGCRSGCPAAPAGASGSPPVGAVEAGGAGVKAPAGVEKTSGTAAAQNESETRSYIYVPASGSH